MSEVITSLFNTIIKVKVKAVYTDYMIGDNRPDEIIEPETEGKVIGVTDNSMYIIACIDGVFRIKYPHEIEIINYSEI